LYELDSYKTSPINWVSTRAIPKALSKNAIEAISNCYDSGAEMVEGAALLPFNPPIQWDEETSLWDFVLEQGRSGREPQQELISLKEEISANTGPRCPMMREFWAAWALTKLKTGLAGIGMTVPGLNSLKAGFGL
jgi:hypothetical protein